MLIILMCGKASQAQKIHLQKIENKKKSEM